MKPPTLQWKHVNEGLPKRSGIVTVFALVNIGSPHQGYSTATIRREPELPCGWTDLQGDPIGEEMQIIYWLNFI